MPATLPQETFPVGASVLRPNALSAIPSSLFTYKDGTLIAEMSDLGARQFHRVYDDACDVGLTVRSEVTGGLVMFVITDREYAGRGEDSELIATHLKSVTKTKAENPRVKMVLFND